MESIQELIERLNSTDECKDIEVGAIDNSIYRQLNGCDSLKATWELRKMRNSNILMQKGKGKSTYYIPDVNFGAIPDNPNKLSAPVDSLSGNPGALSGKLPSYLREEIKNLGKRASGKQKMEKVILDLCSWNSLTLKELAVLIGRNEKYLSDIISLLRKKGKLTYTIPEMPNHPDQAYKTVEAHRKK